MSEMTITESLQRAIRASENAGTVMVDIRISDAAARQLAGELAQMQMIPAFVPADFYHGMKDGGMKFMGKSIVVARA